MEFARIIAVSVVAGFCGHPANAQGEDHDEAFWRTARNCGPNSIYVLAKSLGYEVDYKKLCSSSELGPKGVSLAKLVDAGRACGLPIAAKKGTPEMLANTDELVVAHMDQYRKKGSGGHFVVLVDFDESTRKVRVFDGAAALYSWFPMDHFLRGWSGYVITIERPGALLAVVVYGSLLVLGAGAAFAAGHYERRKRCS